LLQLDANSLLAPLYSATRKSAFAMLKQDMYTYYASDAHKADDYTRFSRATAWIKNNYRDSIA